MQKPALGRRGLGTSSRCRGHVRPGVRTCPGLTGDEEPSFTVDGGAERRRRRTADRVELGSPVDVEYAPGTRTASRRGGGQQVAAIVYGDAEGRRGTGDPLQLPVFGAVIQAAAALVSRSPSRARPAIPDWRPASTRWRCRRFRRPRRRSPPTDRTARECRCVPQPRSPPTMSCRRGDGRLDGNALAAERRTERRFRAGHVGEDVFLRAQGRAPAKARAGTIAIRASPRKARTMPRRLFRATFSPYLDECRVRERHAAQQRRSAAGLSEFGRSTRCPRR